MGVSTISSILFLLCLFINAYSFSVNTLGKTGQSLRMVSERPLTRKELFNKAAGATLLSSFAFLGSAPLVVLAEDEFTTKSGIKVKVLETGTGAKPEVGELAAVRFKGSYKGIVFDDIFSTAQPYFMRVGGGVLMPGVEEAVKMMKVGDRWALEIPGDLGFGIKGRSASPGKPRIPPNAVLDFEIQIVGLPGREVEIIDLLDDPDEMDL